jgi:precorrin-6B methylase 2
MDIKRRSVTSNFIQNFNEAKAIAFERSHKASDSIKNELEAIGYPQYMYLKWIDEGRI